MTVHNSQQRCPKCDEVLFDQTDGSYWVEDIAHHGERVHEALIKVEGVLERAHGERMAAITLIVGGGLIRDAVLARLQTLVRVNEIISFSQPAGNPGVIEIVLRKTRRS